MSDIVVVGAGISGLLAATELAAAGHDVVVIDKGHRPGGRMASRRAEGARFDHGAQFFTVQDERFAALVTGWRDRGLVDTWFRGAPDAAPGSAPAGSPDGHPRMRAVPNMRAVCEHLAADLDVRTGVHVTAVAGHDRGSGWHVATRAGDHLAADAVVLTSPVPQTLALLAEGEVELDTEVQRTLETMTYDPCIAVLALADDLPDFGNAGALRVGGEPIEWLGDNRRKGITDALALTIHLGPATSRDWWALPDHDVGPQACAAAEEVLGVASRAAYIQRWRYSAPRSDPHDQLSIVVSEPAPLALAGDAFAGGRVEGAARSGLAAADRLLALL